MTSQQRTTPSEEILDLEGFERLIAALKQAGYTTIGPLERSGAIVLGEIGSTADIPAGRVDEQDAGRYRLMDEPAGSLFAHVVGPHSLKHHLYPAEIRLIGAHLTDSGFKLEAFKEDPPRYAFIGVRACDTAAVAVLDGVLLDGPSADPVYAARRKKMFIVAVDCTRPGGTCFCVSMKTGPRVVSGFDIAMTELNLDGRHCFVARAGSREGEQILKSAGAKLAPEEDKRLAAEVMEKAARKMGRRMDTETLDALFFEHFEHPHWDEVAARCLTCGNCTLVCPTCFCHGVSEENAVDGRSAGRIRMWDTCFSRDFSYIHGGSVRESARSRYRQWMTHKLVTWVPQFGARGCVGCGRCITWCPVGIDITAEVKALQA
ncbi:4Fe-4S dicluster domain-containing protein [Desulfatiglans anilini]|uniref:4Fe-4S dicluster domain-containing protein n=1 Tax=Desulfatiglans anilini TaxID=90728 RepID=UPI00041C846E|nr:4Fe-4S dicluster domain-containing protein [Desulfatiglans anilini]